MTNAIDCAPRRQPATHNGESGRHGSSWYLGWLLTFLVTGEEAGMPILAAPSSGRH